VTLLTVVAGFTCQYTVITDKISAMVGYNPFSRVAIGTFTQFHAGKVVVGRLLVSKTLLVQEGYSHDE
jgi:hypothetical protein